MIRSVIEIATIRSEFFRSPQTNAWEEATVLKDDPSSRQSNDVHQHLNESGGRTSR